VVRQNTEFIKSALAGAIVCLTKRERMKREGKKENTVVHSFGRGGEGMIIQVFYQVKEAAKHSVSKKHC